MQHTQEQPHMTHATETDHQKLVRLLTIFDEHWSCPDCAPHCASHLETCQNPLHELHEAIYQLSDEQR